jgi:Protein phosphatase 2C
MQAEFEVAGGTIAGRDHVAAGRNNQDAFCWAVTPEAIVAIVADGCSSGRHSEVGAQLGARLTTEALQRLAPRLADEPPEGVLERARQDVLAQLRVLSLAMGGSLSQVVTEYLLFTVVGAVITRRTVVLFTLGDGVTAVNGACRRWSYPGNEPPYLGYALTGSSVTDAAPGLLRYRVLEVRDADAVTSLVVATDGVADLLDAGDERLPGRGETLGGLEQFWRDGRFFRNPFAVTRRLALANRETTAIDWPERRVVPSHGLLPDDTTLVVVRKTA